MLTFGRLTIYTPVPPDAITAENVAGIVNKAVLENSRNRGDSSYLYDYYRGIQPITRRQKQVRPEINNIVVVNRAAEITDFKCAYLMGEPVQYVGRNATDAIMNNILKLNDYMLAEDKANKDSQLAFWFTVCGTAYRLVLPNVDRAEGESPFKIFTLDPINNFVVYHNGITREPVLSVSCVARVDARDIYSVYTRNMFYEIQDSVIIRQEPHALGYVPVIEYRNNLAKLGGFEIVLSLLDAINNVESNRLDGVEQFIQSLLKFVNVDIESEELQTLKELGAIKFRSDSTNPADVSYLSQELNQKQTQTLVDNLYNEVLTIVGMPSQSDGSSSDSSNNGAVIMRTGWHTAEARAKQTELMFKQAEREFLRIVFKICNDLDDLDLKIYDIEQKFTRRNYADILTKSQVLTTMLANPKIHPSLAFSHCGLFVDSEAAYAMSKEYYDKTGSKEQELEDIKKSMKLNAQEPINNNKAKKDIDKQENDEDGESDEDSAEATN
jgi:SPP1 family phage portal protein